MSRRRPPSMSGPLLALAVASAAGVALIYLVAVQTAAGQRLDRRAVAGLSPARNPEAYAAGSDLLNTISVSAVAVLGLLVMALALVRRRPVLALGTGAVILGANATTQVLKATLERPDLLGLGPFNGPPSFPSGHVTVAMSLAMALTLVSPPAVRPAAAAAGALYAVAIGVAVIGLDWHRPSDVAGAYLVCVAWTASVAALLEGVERRAGRRVRASRARGGVASPRTAAVAVLVLGGTFLALAAVAGARRVETLRVLDDRTAFISASVLLAGLCLALAAGVAAMLQRGASGPRPHAVARRG